MNDEDDPEFADLIPGVRRLHSDRVNVYRQRGVGKTRPRTPQDDPAREAEPAPPASTQRAVHFDAGLQKKLQRRIRRGQIRPEASLDLHGCRQHEALQMLESFVDDAVRQGLRMIIIIHGQGFRSQQDAVLKPLVQRWLGSQPRVLAWCPAQPRDGAAGASYVYLRAG